MEFNKAEIVIHKAGGDQTHVSLIPFQFVPGNREDYTGADGSGGIVQRAGWLGLKMANFPGWQSASIIELSYADGHNGDHVFHVTTTFKRPERDGEWLWFPVMPQGDVSTYKD
jgi:hypothetical protein